MTWVAPRAWGVSETLTSAKMNEISSSLHAVGDPWTSYTPSWTASTTSPTLGNGSLTGAYTQAGKLVHFRVGLTMGSSTAFGTGNWFFTLPVAPNLTGGVGIDSGGLLFDVSGVARHALQVVTQNSSGVVFLLDATSGNTVTATAPWTWASTDQVTFGGTYEAA